MTAVLHGKRKTVRPLRPCVIFPCTGTLSSAADRRESLLPLLPLPLVGNCEEKRLLRARADNPEGIALVAVQLPETFALRHNLHPRELHRKDDRGRFLVDGRTIGEDGNALVLDSEPDGDPAGAESPDLLQKQQTRGVGKRLAWRREQHRRQLSRDLVEGRG
eukprot:CAMPEP_0196726434 /NCGR_PEP_ID=MMETSP1091-20130531/7711_1 /TAXON_ID=302021 /ORGANISM="Rhodomonas sp., Strain CCMP768" /LENGTH=161 /DNA_ID=CAMNT_0042068877 /DNA_START=58 /DNA_END=540 /DNA_ORIENTATION=+